MRRPYAGDPLPDALCDHAALVVLGGAMGAYDTSRHSWLDPTQRLIAEALALEVPFLGLCLGHQLAAVALGGGVSLRPEGPGSGVAPVTPTSELTDDPVFAALPANSVTIEWNNDIVSELPTGAVVLSRDEADHPQIVRYGRLAWGVQCHPEVTAAVFDSWLTTKPAPPHLAARRDAIRSQRRCTRRCRASSASGARPWSRSLDWPDRSSVEPAIRPDRRQESHCVGGPSMSSPANTAATRSTAANPAGTGRRTACATTWSTACRGLS